MGAWGEWHPCRRDGPWQDDSGHLVPLLIVQGGSLQRALSRVRSFEHDHQLGEVRLFIINLGQESQYMIRP